MQTERQVSLQVACRLTQFQLVAGVCTSRANDIGRMQVALQTRSCILALIWGQRIGMIIQKQHAEKVYISLPVSDLCSALLKYLCLFLLKQLLCSILGRRTLIVKLWADTNTNVSCCFDGFFMFSLFFSSSFGKGRNERNLHYKK